MKRKIGSIVDNMLVLVDNPCDGEPFINRILAGLTKAYETITDDEAKKVIQKASDGLNKINNQLLEFKNITKENVIKIIQKECCFENVIDLDTLIVEYVAEMCSYLIKQRVFKKEVWEETFLPYFKFTDKASSIFDK